MIAVSLTEVSWGINLTFFSLLELLNLLTVTEINQ